MERVIFFRGNQEDYDAKLEQGDILPNGIYFIVDTQRIYLGETIMGAYYPDGDTQQYGTPNGDILQYGS